MKSEARNQGIGKALFAELGKVAQEKVVCLGMSFFVGQQPFFP